MNTVRTKFCNDCEKEKIESDFHRNGPYLRSNCKSCFKLKNDAYRQQDSVRNQRKENCKTYYKNNKEKWQTSEHKAGRKIYNKEYYQSQIILDPDKFKNSGKYGDSRRKAAKQWKLGKPGQE